MGGRLPMVCRIIEEAHVRQRLAKMLKSAIANVGKDVERQECSHPASGKLI